MKNYGLIRTAAAVPTVKVADCGYNAESICTLAEKAYENKASIVVFPELCTTGHSCGDLFRQTLLIEGAEEGICRIAKFSKGRNMAIIAGAPVPYGSHLYNCSIVIYDGCIKGIVPKTHLSQTEMRIFSSGSCFTAAGTQLEIRYAGDRKSVV